VKETVPLVVAKDSWVTLPRASREGLKADYVYDQPVKAPIAVGQNLGKIVVSAPGMQTFEIPLVAGEAVPELGFAARFVARVKALFAK
jgi:D-alanyl-D-alanine carboxypeptidase (penicillin-binding protein 5/6)